MPFSVYWYRSSRSAACCSPLAGSRLPGEFTIAASATDWARSSLAAGFLK